MSPGTDDGVRLRTHPITAVLKGVRHIGLLVVFALIFTDAEVGQLVGELGVLSVLGLAVLAGAIVAGHALAWMRTQYFFDAAGNFGVDSGVIARKERRLALSRLQSVDVVRPLLGRLVGMAQVRVEMAGGDESRVLLSYLSEASAHALRAEILARAAGLDPGTAEAPETVLVTVPTRDLIVSLALRSETIGLLLISGAVVTVSVASAGISGLGVLVLTGGLPALAIFSQFMRFFGFTLAESPDGLRLRHGLASVSSQTVPPGRVQAVEIRQPLLWRRRGWVGIYLNLAAGPTGDQQQVESVLLPVAPAEIARQIVGRVYAGVDPWALPLVSPGPTARRRAWLQWPNLAAGATEEVFVAQRGWLTKRFTIMPHARMQSVSITQGPWQRRLGLATVRLDSTPGPVSVEALHRPVDEAVAMATSQLQRAAQARATDVPARWLARQSPVEGDVPPTERPPDH